jgi:hypothetical protein
VSDGIRQTARILQASSLHEPGAQLPAPDAHDRSRPSAVAFPKLIPLTMEGGHAERQRTGGAHQNDRGHACQPHRRALLRCRNRHSASPTPSTMNGSSAAPKQRSSWKPPIFTPSAPGGPLRAGLLLPIRSGVQHSNTATSYPSWATLVRKPAGAGDHLDASPDHQVSRNEQAVTGRLLCGDPALVPRTSPGAGCCLLSWQ